MTDLPRLDHVGITVDDLEEAVRFFVALRLEVEGRMELEDPFLDEVTGIPDSRTEIAMLTVPGGGSKLELASYVRPDATHGSTARMPNEVGIRNVCLEVTDLRAEVERCAADGYPMVGQIGEWQDTWAMAYVRGPSGVIVSLTQRIS